MLLQIIAADPVTPRSLRSDIPRRRDHLPQMSACLPERRYASMAALAEDLRRWRDEPIEARPASALSRGRFSAGAGLPPPRSGRRHDRVRRPVGGHALRSQLDAKNTDLQAALKKADLERERSRKGETAARPRLCRPDQPGRSIRDSAAARSAARSTNHLRPAPGENDRAASNGISWNAGRARDLSADPGPLRELGLLSRRWPRVRLRGRQGRGDGLGYGTGSIAEPLGQRTGQGRRSSVFGRRQPLRLHQQRPRILPCAALRPGRPAGSRHEVLAEPRSVCAILSPDDARSPSAASGNRTKGARSDFGPQDGRPRLLWRRSATNITHFVFSPDSSTLAIAYHRAGAAAIECIDVVSGTRKGRVLERAPRKHSWARSLPRRPRAGLGVQRSGGQGVGPGRRAEKMDAARPQGTRMCPGVLPGCVGSSAARRPSRPGSRIVPCAFGT